MSVSNEDEMKGIAAAAAAVAETLHAMKQFARAGMSTLELDAHGEALLKARGARSAPKETYGFPGATCISMNEEVAHGLPAADRILKEGDLINIDVSAELNGFWADNGGSFVIGRDRNGHLPLLQASRTILLAAIDRIRSGQRVNETGRFIQQHAAKLGYTVIRNLTGHGIGRRLHEKPSVENYYERHNQDRYAKNMVVAVETFISTRSTLAETAADDWTLLGNRGGYVAQFEHTILVNREQPPLILTAANGFSSW
ncbi:type I methionyl aminopeptidase [Pedobacter yulinensis]|uniref:Methionine aminopeptidase n=1 Tax=Pedobacter yulinensis TaxID=2126353 RepID=A0A2T3HMR8_9SPHI|nr:type I methionyl aminopeptidase [Pedobacter yulinensis]PST83735.1 type I methionyl aminopeptidase [Pedobacter yulinensis]